MELKQPTTYLEQIGILESRNVIIDDIYDCIDFLRQVRYYRLSAYLLPFKRRNDIYRPVHFRQIKDIYEFDQQLRTILSRPLENIEISLRSSMSYIHALQYGPDGYLLSDNYNSRHDHFEFQNHVNACIYDNRKTLVAKHHNSNYHGIFPVWVVIEFFSMGMLSHFYRGMETPIKKAIARDFGTSYRNLESWLRCITDLRNQCAHCARLYYWIFPAIPRLQSDLAFKPDRRLFTQLYMLKLIYPDKPNWNTDFVIPLENLISAYDSSINLKHIGFPKNWKELLIT